ncbi:hypothetical protein BKG82_27060 [Mycobacteroides chelonae]|uniref:Uncharacterized protein n=1 Tax=Mycobacteroides chelonae TaxID=1774 RepID=A0A1S1LL41_MYCCH|nr:hypothetical protein [Mycobacteroides chelonae]OHU47314.1 hypothetical protein BKG82_27060 [Mycobacteroides chelonae]
MRNRGTGAANGEAFAIEAAGTRTPVTALQVERYWTAQQRAAARFECAGCEARVYPCAMDSPCSSPYFRCGSSDPHRRDCQRESLASSDNAGESRTSARGRRGQLPDRLVLEDRATAAPESATTPESGAAPRRTRGSGSASSQSTRGRSRTAYALGRIVATWLELATNDARRQQPLQIPAVTAENYLYAFRKIAARDGMIPPMEPRVFYAALRFSQKPEDTSSDTTVLRLQAGRQVCTLTIDKTGWSAGRRAALTRDLEWAYRRGRQLWIEDRTRSIWVFVVAQQDPQALDMFTVADQRLLYLTDEEITYS